MFALSAKASSVRAVSSCRANRQAPIHLLARKPLGSSRRVAVRAEVDDLSRRVAVRADQQVDDATAATDESLAKFQSAANDAVDWVKAKWNGTDDSEKPAAVAIIVGVIVAQIAIGATIDAVDKIPIFKQLLELLGLFVTGVFAYRYATDPAERDSVKRSLDGFVKSVTGDK